MKLTEKRKTAIYGAVYDRLMDLRVQLQRQHSLSAEIDVKIAQAMDHAGRAAIEAAETGKHTQFWRSNHAGESK